MSLSRRKFLVSGSVFVLAGTSLSLGLLPRMTGLAWAEPADLQAELAKPAPEGDIILGSDKAPVTIVEYASMTCPHCAHFAATTFPELRKRYIDTGKVRYIFREFPIGDREMLRLSAAASMLARCASKDGGAEKYMAVVESLFSKQDQWIVENPLKPLEDIAKQFGFTDDSFKACLTNQKVVDDIAATRDTAIQKLGVDATPTFFVNGKKLVGDLPIDALAKEIDPYLKTG